MSSRRVSILLALLAFGLISLSGIGLSEPPNEHPQSDSNTENSSGQAKHARQAKSAQEEKTKKNDFVQPSYTRWSVISKDMTEKEVITLLGMPLARSEQTPEFERYRARFSEEEAKHLAYAWNYGHLQFDSPAFPEPFEFRVVFINGKVELNTDPFDGNLSGDGKPTTPEMILPRDNEVFHHNPRWLDMRWTPSAGIYPIEYEVDIDTGSIATGIDLELKAQSADPWRSLRTYKSSAPQLTVAYSGGWPGRWRVRAVNKLGYSEWTEYRTFIFNDKQN
jgi:hypothetical protein